MNLSTVAGNYNINILYEGKHIPGSPFRAAVRADLDTRAIRCYGPGLDPTGVYEIDSTAICFIATHSLIHSFIHIHIYTSTSIQSHRIASHCIASHALSVLHVVSRCFCLSVCPSVSLVESLSRSLSMCVCISLNGCHRFI
jgi:hypothetical protein